MKKAILPRYSSRRIQVNLKHWFGKIWREKTLYLMISPTILFFVLFRVLPIYNMRLAFFNYSSRKSWEFAGLKYFHLIFSSSGFMSILKNTLILSFMKYILLFPAAVIFAILLNELRSSWFRKYVQVVTYLPHFLSWVVIGGIWILALSLNGGVNQLLGIFHFPKIDFMTSRVSIRWVLMLSEAWRSIGWDSIFYFTAIINIPAHLFEAAEMDGANRLNMIRSIIIPALVAPMLTIFIMNLGFFLNAGFDQVLNFSNNAVLSTIDIIDTYIYRIGIENGQYSLASAVGLLKGVFGTGLVLMMHFVSKKITGKGVW